VRVRRAGHYRPSALVLTLALLSVWTAGHAQTSSLQPGPKPPEAAPSAKLWIGEYGPDGPLLSTVAEKDGELILFGEGIGTCSLPASAAEELGASCSLQEGVSLSRKAHGVPSLRTGAGTFARRDFGVDVNQVARIHPVRPVAELRADALKAS